MGFSKPPKMPAVSQGPSAELLAAQREAAKASKFKLPPIERQSFAPPAQESAADVAAAERMARQQMSKKKGLQWSQNPQQTLG